MADAWAAMHAQSPGGASSSPGQPTNPVVGLKRSGSWSPLFLVAPVFGSVFPYHYLAMYMDPQQPIYGLQSPALDGHSEAHDNIPDMARDYIAAMKEVQPQGPYYLGGYSFGGWTAYEMARQLLLAGEPVAFLGMLGTGVPPCMAMPMVAKLAEYYWTLAGDQARLMQDTGLTEQQRLLHKTAAASQGTPLQRVAMANNLAAMRYVPRPIERGLSLFTTIDSLSSSPGDRTMGWWMLCTREIDVHLHEGNHLSCFTEPHVQDLAAQIRARLAIARERGA